MENNDKRIWFKRHYFLEEIGPTQDGVWYKMGADNDVWPFYFSFEKDEKVYAKTVDFDGGPFLGVGDVFPVVNRRILAINMVNVTIKLAKEVEND